MIIVTGATSGIGRATAAVLADRGVTVGAVGRRQALLDQLSAQRTNIITVSADLSSSAGIDQVVGLASNYEIAGIVHGAGTHVDPVEYCQLDGADLIEAMAVHVSAPLDLNNRILTQLTRQPSHRSGNQSQASTRLRIVFIDSYSATSHRIGWSAYSIVKAAAQMAARAAAAELPHAITVRVFPGAVNTPLVSGVLNSPNDSPTRALFELMAANDQLAEPEQAATFIAHLLLDATEDQLDNRSSWDFNKPEDHLF